MTMILIRILRHLYELLLECKSNPHLTIPSLGFFCVVLFFILQSMKRDAFKSSGRTVIIFFRPIVNSILGTYNSFLGICFDRKSNFTGCTNRWSKKSGLSKKEEKELICLYCFISIVESWKQNFYPGLSSVIRFLIPNLIS